MAIATYDDLVESIIKWSHRKDILTLIPDFVALAEYEMYNNAETQLRIRDSEIVSTALTAGRYISTPPNFEEARSVELLSGGDYVSLIYAAPEQLKRLPSNGRPTHFTVVGEEIEFNVTPDSEYTIQIQYYKRPDAINDANQTNSIITNYPNIYLYGTLHQLFLWSMDADETIKYAGKFQDAIKGANKANKKARYGSAPAMSTEYRVV